MRNTSAFFLLLAATAMLYSSCKKDPVNPNVITKTYYFQAVLDGDTVTYQDGSDNYVNIVGDFFGGQVLNGWEYAPFTCIADAAAASNANPTTLASSGAVSVIAMTSSQITTLQAYQTLFSTGVFDYGRLSRVATDSATAGAFVSIFDDASVEWNTNNGQQDSTASFVLTEYYASVDNNRFPATQQVFTAEFNCKVFNAAGASKNLTGGKVKGRMIVF